MIIKDSRLMDIINKHSKIAILSGAGVSVDSGIPSFRGKGGIYFTEYKGHRPQEILSEVFFKRNKALFWEYLNEMILNKGSEPNRNHLFAKYLMENNKLSGVLTQNIDGLYQLAEVAPVVEIHGNAHYGFCEKCKDEYLLSELELNRNGLYLSPCCNRVIKPSIVLYDGTFLTKDVKEYYRVMNEASLLIVMGTGLDISWHKDNVIEFNGEIALINDTDVELLGWAGHREFDYKFIGEFKDII